MNTPRTESILQRVPVILAVTAASYGLPRTASPGCSQRRPAPPSQQAARRRRDARANAFE
jgi:hypothetical protein